MPQISSLLQQYKSDTDRFTKWLAEAAVNHDYDLAAFQRETKAGQDALTSGTGISKADSLSRRRTAVESRARADTSKDTRFTTLEPDAKAYQVRISQFVPIAQHLARKAIEIPANLVRIGRRCIERRKQVGLELDGRSEAVPGGHRHFISVLEQTVDLLERHSSRSSSTSSRSPSGPSSIDVETSNPFSVLKDDEALNQPELDLPKPPSCPDGSRTPATFSLVLSRDDSVFQAVLFVVDLCKVRWHLQEVWRDYKAKKLDLVTASLITNTALELLRKPHDVFVRTAVPPWGSLRALIIPTLQKMAHGVVNISPELSLDFFMVYRILGQIPMHGLSSNQMPLCVAGSIEPPYRPDDWGKPWDRDTRQSQSEVLICETLTDYFLFAQTDLKTADKDAFELPFDEIAQTMNIWADAHEVTLMTVMCAQVFLDINLVLGSGVSRGIKEMQGEMKRMLATIEYRNKHAFCKADLYKHGGAWPDVNEEQLEMLTADLRGWQDGSLVQERRDRGDHEALGKSTLLERSPALCGSVLFSTLLRYRNIGMAMANTYAYIQSANALDQAVRLARRIDLKGAVSPSDTFVYPAWPDIRKLLALHPVKEVFGSPDGKIPMTHDQLHVGYLKLIGQSDAAIRAYQQLWEVGGQTPNILRAAEANPGSAREAISLEDNSQLAQMFLYKYTADDDEESLAAGYAPKPRTIDIRHIEALLKKLRGTKSSQDVYIARMSSLMLSSRSDDNIAKPVSRAQSARVQSSDRYTIPQLLCVLEGAFIDPLERSRLYFDYMSLHTRCKILFDTVGQGMSRYMCQVDPVGTEQWARMAKDSRVCTMKTLRQVADAVKAAKEVGMSENMGRKVARVHCKYLADMMAPFIETAGSAEVDKLKRVLG